MVLELIGRVVALVAVLWSVTLAHAADPTLLHVNTFPTARSLPFYVAVDRGFFARRGLKYRVRIATPPDMVMVCGIAAGIQTARCVGTTQAQSLVRTVITPRDA